MLLREVPESERPYSRMRYNGTKDLSNSDLVQIITGIQELNKCADAIKDGPSALKGSPIEQIAKDAGLTLVQASKLCAAAELGARIAAETTYARKRIFAADDVYQMFAAEYAGEKQETVTELLLNVKYEVIGRETVSKGGIMSAHIEPRDVFRPAIRRGATGVILVHNHPSGDPTPSEDDLKATETFV